MRSSILQVMMATVLAGYTGVAAASEPPPATAAPKPARTFTEEEAALLKKLLLHTSAEPDYGPAPLTVQFTVEHFETDNPVEPEYTWDFGDGSPPSHEQNPKHTYKKPGKYKAVIKVTDKVGQAGEDDMQIDVEPPEE